MAKAICSNDALSRQGKNLAAQLNPLSFCRLFRNNIVLSPATVRTDLSEATFPGYAAANLAGKWSQPKRLSSGLWQITFPIQVFTPTIFTGQIIYGAWVELDSVLFFSTLFQNPFAPGPLDPVSVSIAVQFADMSVYCNLV